MQSTETTLVYDFDVNMPIKSCNDRIAYMTTKRAWLRTRCAEAQNWKCCYCGEEMNLSAHSKKRVTLEHVLPRSMGGKDEYDNCAAACYRCNNRRENKLLNPDYTIPTDFLKKSPKPFLGKHVRRFVRLYLGGRIASLASYDEWFSSTKLKQCNRDELLNVIREESGIVLTA